MSESDPRDDAYLSQGQWFSLIDILGKLLQSLFPQKPIHPDCFYTREYVMRWAGIGDGTWTVWCQTLRTYRPRTKQIFVLGRDLIAFMTSPEIQSAETEGPEPMPRPKRRK